MASSRNSFRSMRCMMMRNYADFCTHYASISCAIFVSVNFAEQRCLSRSDCLSSYPLFNILFRRIKIFFINLIKRKSNKKYIKQISSSSQKRSNSAERSLSVGDIFDFRYASATGSTRRERVARNEIKASWWAMPWRRVGTWHDSLVLNRRRRSEDRCLMSLALII